MVVWLSWRWRVQSSLCTVECDLGQVVYTHLPLVTKQYYLTW